MSKFRIAGALFCFVVIIALTFISISEYTRLKSCRAEYQTLQKEKARLRYDFDAVAAQDSIRILIAGNRINPRLPIVDRRARAVSIEEVLSQSSLVIYFPSVNCYTCYKKIFDRIDETIGAEELHRVALLTNYENFNRFQDFVVLSRTRYSCYNIDTRSLPTNDLFRRIATIKPILWHPLSDGMITNPGFFNDPRPGILTQYFNKLTLAI